MNSECFRNICRICLADTIVLDWNATLYGYYDMTYKDCFYKYTQLERIDSDPFSPMLCQICLNSLYNLHTFVTKALETHKYFQGTYCPNIKLDQSTTFREDIKYTPTEFEKIEVEPIIQPHFAYEHSDEDVVKPLKAKVEKCSKRYRSNTMNPTKYENAIEKSFQIERKPEECLNGLDTKYNLLTQSINEVSKKSHRKNKRRSHDKNSEKLTLGDEIIGRRKEKRVATIEDELLVESVQFWDGQTETKVKKKYKELKKPRMCSICSKILHNKHAVQMHEKTHMENRERNETCKICGLKFYDKRNLYSHKRIHKENREKIHKCEFCNKAFYNKGGLNIHRRIHLGQMIPCSLCSKQYFRQIDLDRHMSSHSATAINSEMKKRSRYFVRCKHCDKSILSTSFKSHTAAHLNEPLMKCSICSKEFFRRGSCVLHLRKVHQKTTEVYNDFIIIYKKNRISHLFLEQKADIQATDE